MQSGKLRRVYTSSRIWPTGSTLRHRCASGQGYIYNLSTRGLARGTWELRFTMSGDPTTYVISFDVR